MECMLISTKCCVSQSKQATATGDSIRIAAHSGTHQCSIFLVFELLHEFVVVEKLVVPVIFGYFLNANYTSPKSMLWCAMPIPVPPLFLIHKLAITEILPR